MVTALQEEWDRITLEEISNEIQKLPTTMVVINSMLNISFLPFLFSSLFSHVLRPLRSQLTHVLLPL